MSVELKREDIVHSPEASGSSLDDYWAKQERQDRVQNGQNNNNKSNSPPPLSLASTPSPIPPGTSWKVGPQVYYSENGGTERSTIIQQQPVIPPYISKILPISWSGSDARTGTGVLTQTRLSTHPEGVEEKDGTEHILRSTSEIRDLESRTVPFIRFYSNDGNPNTLGNGTGNVGNNNNNSGNNLNNNGNTGNNGNGNGSGSNGNNGNNNIGNNNSGNNLALYSPSKSHSPIKSTPLLTGSPRSGDNNNTKRTILTDLIVPAPIPQRAPYSPLSPNSKLLKIRITNMLFDLSSQVRTLKLLVVKKDLDGWIEYFVRQNGNEDDFND